jgi:Immunoglobulin I-set domain
MVAKNEAGGALNNGIYNFVDFAGNGGAPVPLPWIPGGVQHIVTTNLFLNFGSTYSKILTFDMNPQGTIVYAADNTFGIVKFVNNGGTWSSPYIFGTNNLGTASQPKGGQGCFGIAVDFSGTNPVIYATTMEEGDGVNVCSNRLIRIVDTGNPGTNLVAQTLAVANGINEGFRGLDFTPDLTPLITSQPQSVNTTTNVSATFSVTASSVYPLSYQWQENGTNIADNFNITGSTTNTLTFLHSSLTNAGNYTVIITNQYGSVTSVVATLTVSAVAVLPSITNAVLHLTNFIGNNMSFSVNPNGTPPFDYQWYFGTT